LTKGYVRFFRNWGEKGGGKEEYLGKKGKNPGRKKKNQF